MCRVQGVLEVNHVRHMFAQVVEGAGESEERKRKGGGGERWIANPDEGRREYRRGESADDSTLTTHHWAECGRCGEGVFGRDGTALGLSCGAGHREWKRRLGAIRDRRGMKTL